MKRHSRITFDSPYESVRYVADQNWNWFCYAAAARGYEQAADLAPSEAQRQECLERLAFCRKELPTKNSDPKRKVKP